MFNIKNLNDEYFSLLDQEEVLDIKSLSTDDKIKCFKYFLSTDIITNFSAITNIYFIISGISKLDNDIENDNRIFFNDLEEYVDIKIELSEYINKFKIKIAEYYLCIITGLHVKLPDMKIHITNTYYNIFNIIDMDLISRIMLETINQIDTKNIKPAFNSEDLYNSLNKIYKHHTIEALKHVFGEYKNVSQFNN